MILADTSAWVEYDRRTGSAAHLRVRSLLIEEPVVLAITEPVIMETLAGAVDDAREDDLRRLLARAELLPLDAPADFASAARIYRRCRRAGLTPRGLLDCLIVAVAWRAGASVLSWDRDLLLVAAVLGVAVDQGSLPRP